MQLHFTSSYIDQQPHKKQITKPLPLHQKISNTPPKSNQVVIPLFTPISNTPKKV